MKDDINVITNLDSKYPALLREIPDAPEQLFVRGNVELFEHKHLLAVVGSRRVQAYGKQAANMLLPPIVRAGGVLVSGLAYGVDSIAHTACVHEGKPTIAVIGGGINDEVIYPRTNVKLAHAILEHGGLIISEYPAGTTARPGYFPARNRIIAGLCRATLIIQAATKSGSLITARLALEYNRDVLAVPGQITDPYSAGANYLIHEGATPVLSPQDIAQALELVLPEASQINVDTLSEMQRKIFDHTSNRPIHVDDLSGKLGMPTHEISAHLLELEFANVVMHIGGMKYVRKNSSLA